MITLIGDGGHARDIADERLSIRRFSHHSEYVPKPEDRVVIGVNDPQVRANIADELGVEDIAWLHTQSYVSRSCEIGYGTHVNYGVSMTRTKTGSHCTIAPGVTICGDVTIGDRVFIGAGAVVRNLVTIGDDAFVCMGAVVTRDVAPGEKYR